MTHMVQNAVEWNCHHRNWNLIGVELPLSELELEWNCFYRNWNWNLIAFGIGYRIRIWSGIAFIRIGIGIELQKRN